MSQYTNSVYFYYYDHKNAISFTDYFGNSSIDLGNMLNSKFFRAWMKRALEYILFFHFKRRSFSCGWSYQSLSFPTLWYQSYCRSRLTCFYKNDRTLDQFCSNWVSFFRICRSKGLILVYKTSNFLSNCQFNNPLSMMCILILLYLRNPSIADNEWDLFDANEVNYLHITSAKDEMKNGLLTDRLSLWKDIKIRSSHLQFQRELRDELWVG